MALHDISCGGNRILVAGIQRFAHNLLSHHDRLLGEESHPQKLHCPIFDLIPGAADTMLTHQEAHHTTMHVSGIPIVEDDDEMSNCSHSFTTKEIHFAIFTKEAPVPIIKDVKALDRELPELCSSIFNALSSKELEATFQRCLARDLTEAGVHIEQEVEIQLKYKGQRVGTRRADIVLQTPSDGQRVVLELKAVGTLTSEHLKQLQFYMHHLDIDKGYLINFPHDSGFPDTPVAVDGSVFKHAVVLGDPQLTDRSTRGKHADATVQIVKVVRSDKDVVQILKPPSITRSTPKVQPSPVPQPSGVESPPQKSRPISTFVPAIAKSTGKLCLLCTKKQAYCRFHSDVNKPASSDYNKTRIIIPKLKLGAGLHIFSSDKAGIAASSVKTRLASKSSAGVSLSRLFQVPIAKTTGMPCKLCTKSQAYCRFHVRKAQY